MIYNVFCNNEHEAYAGYSDKSFIEAKYDFVQSMETNPECNNFIQVANTDQIVMYVGPGFYLVAELDTDYDHHKYYIYRRVVNRTDELTKSFSYYRNDDLTLDDFIEKTGRFDLNTDDCKKIGITYDDKTELLGQDIRLLFKLSGVAVLFETFKVKNGSNVKNCQILTVLLQLNRHTVTLDDILKK